MGFVRGFDHRSSNGRSERLRELALGVCIDWPIDSVVWPASRRHLSFSGLGSTNHFLTLLCGRSVFNQPVTGGVVLHTSSPVSVTEKGSMDCSRSCFIIDCPQVGNGSEGVGKRTAHSHTHTHTHTHTQRGAISPRANAHIDLITLVGE